MFFGKHIWNMVTRMYKNKSRRMVVCKYCNTVQRISLDENDVTICSICKKKVEPKVNKDREKTNE